MLEAYIPVEIPDEDVTSYARGQEWPDDYLVPFASEAAATALAIQSAVMGLTPWNPTHPDRLIVAAAIYAAISAPLGAAPCRSVPLTYAEEWGGLRGLNP